MDGANYAQKRDLFRSLNFKAIFLDDEGRRRIKVSCEIAVETELYLS